MQARAQRSLPLESCLQLALLGGVKQHQGAAVCCGLAEREAKPVELPLLQRHLRSDTPALHTPPRHRTPHPPLRPPLGLLHR